MAAAAAAAAAAEIDEAAAAAAAAAASADAWRRGVRPIRENRHQVSPETDFLPCAWPASGLRAALP